MIDPGAIVPASTGEWGEFTKRDIDSVSDNCLSYELVDGMLAISRPQGVIHQRAVGQLVTRLARACPNDLEVLPALPFRPTAQRSLLPDVLVLDIVDRTSVDCHLVVEVLTPATRIWDLSLKREIYAEAGVPSYWIFDPAEALLTDLELVGGRYVERAQTKGTDAFDAKLPFPVRIIPASLTCPNNRR